MPSFRFASTPALHQSRSSGSPGAAMGLDEAGADFLCGLQVSADNKLRNSERRTLVFFKNVAAVLLGARCLSGDASPHTSLTPSHEDDAGFSALLLIPGPSARAAELSADQGRLSFTFAHTCIPLHERKRRNPSLTCTGVGLRREKELQAASKTSRTPGYT